MAWFNVVKGAYPSLQQIDKTLSVGSRVTGIVRGTLIYETPTSVWALCDNTVQDDPTAYPFFALMAQTDLTAGMAGSVGQGLAGGVARVTGLAVGMPMEFETDQFDNSVGYLPGALLIPIAGGKLGAHVSTNNCVAQVTKSTVNKWVNDAVAVTGWRTGALRSILTARTVWIPTLTTSP